MIRRGLQFEILSCRAQMEFREIKFYEKTSVAFDISAIISIPTTKFHCSARCNVKEYR